MTLHKLVDKLHENADGKDAKEEEAHGNVTNPNPNSGVGEDVVNLSELQIKKLRIIFDLVVGIEERTHKNDDGERVGIFKQEDLWT